MNESPLQALGRLSTTRLALPIERSMPPLSSVHAGHDALGERLRFLRRPAGVMLAHG